jgi:hypothetical protein
MWTYVRSPRKKSDVFLLEEDECPLQQDHADVTDLMFLLN